ncbi:nucleolar protein 4-like isoform X1 [Patella vulgata]|uniref:nucleolar protein 4-like isoform X1 n=2 Tax=Patella vulgata TaxID=6465 RepID=UPI00217FB8F3|nr:nucleolar protein 4-like isoform X1 [Patella vulgata]
MSSKSPSILSEQSVEEGQSMTPMDVASPQGAGTGILDEDRPLNMTNKSFEADLKSEDKGQTERKRRASNESEDSVVTKASEGGVGDDILGSKDEEDDDDNEEDENEKLSKNHDPERLKAFNMFCRLFVDENLDRTVPISKQPKDKVQAILEACDRQFPEFHVRSRKRIRTYLKSCRRMRRTKEQNGWEPLRPTPPHLTSAAAESLLAQACENESTNAKRMRMGMEPLPARSMTIAPVTPTITAPHPQTTQSPKANSQPHADRNAPTNNDFVRHQTQAPAFRPAPDFPSPFFANGNGLFRPGFPGYQHPAHHHPTVLQHPVIQNNNVQNGEFGPTDLSMKKQNNKSQLSGTELSTIKQLIAGYRESAAFLYRSADELEQLLLHQN